jgi:hypothetical protein
MPRLAIALAVLAAASSPALADTSTPRTAEGLAASDCARARARQLPCVLTLEAEELEGGVARADGTTVAPRTFATFDSLIRVRADFRVELIRAAERL